MSRWLRFALAFLAVTVAAFSIHVCVIASVRVGGIHSSDVYQGDRIRALNSFRLISPDWVSPRGDMIEWMNAETRARTGLMVVLWLIAVLLMMRRHWVAMRRKED